MTTAATTPAPRARTGLRLKLVGLFAPKPLAASQMLAKPRAARRSARATLLWFLLASLLIHLGALAALDAPWPNVRDPEYGMRAHRLRARAAGRGGGGHVALVHGREAERVGSLTTERAE